MKKNLTIEDIAQKAGVSKSTVSRYLNQGYVKEETKAIIKKIIEENKYEPNAFARLKAKESKIIGIIAPCLDSTVTSMVLMALDETLKQEGYLSLIMNTNHKIEDEFKFMERLQKMNVDGIIVNATTIEAKHAEIAKNAKVPLLFLAQTCEEYPSISNEDYAAGKKVGEYVVETNHKDVVVISVDPSDVAIGVHRLQGIKDGLARSKTLKCEIVRSTFGNVESYRNIDSILSKRKPDMIICSTTRQLLATYKCCKDHNFKIPEDISIIGFGGYDVVDILEPLPTTVQFHPQQLGRLGAKTILNLIREEEVDCRQEVPYLFLEGTSVRRR